MFKKILIKVGFIAVFIINLFCRLIGFLLAGFYLIYRFFIPYTQGSHPLSKYFRKIFEKKKAKTNWSLGLLILILFLHPYISPFSGRPKLENTSNIAFASSGIILTSPENAITTESAYQKPVQGWISQNFSYFHPAIDIAADLDEKVYPVTSGFIESVEFTAWGYGHFIIINHNDGYKSLYAHLNNINVKSGDSVDKNTVLGDIGLTGRTTGPHLHLEIYHSKEGNINPIDVIPDLFQSLICAE